MRMAELRVNPSKDLSDAHSAPRTSRSKGHPGPRCRAQAPCRVGRAAPQLGQALHGENMSKVKDHLIGTLRETERVLTRVAFWKIPHRTNDDTISFKIGRYTKPKTWNEAPQPETLKPKSELTLTDEEFRALIEFLQEWYEPFKEGVKAFIPLKRPFSARTAGRADPRSFFAS